MSPSLTVNNTVIWQRILVDAPYQVKCTPTPGFKVCCCCWLKINTKFFSTSNWMTVLFLSVNEVKYINSRFFSRKHMLTALELNLTVSYVWFLLYYWIWFVDLLSKNATSLFTVETNLQFFFTILPLLLLIQRLLQTSTYTEKYWLFFGYFFGRLFIKLELFVLLILDKTRV